MQEEIHPDHREDYIEGGENRLSRCDAAEFLRKIRGLDRHIERGKDDVSAFTPLSAGIHWFEVGS